MNAFSTLISKIPSGKNNEDDTMTLTGKPSDFEAAMKIYAADKMRDLTGRIELEYRGLVSIKKLNEIVSTQIEALA